MLIKLWLAHRHLSHIQVHRAEVPEAFNTKISLQEHQKAADYTSSKVRFGRWPMLYDAGLLLIWTFGGGLELLDQSWQGMEYTPVYTGIAVILSMMLIGSVLDLPFSIYSTFVIEEKFGFNRTTAKTFVADLFKGLALTLVIGTPLIWVVLWLMEQAGALWWIYTWLVWTGFSLFLAWAYPTWIAPIFNKFKPLEEGETLQRINQLLQRCGFNSNGIFVIDGSRRSSHGNAYFSGFGKNKRIVFFDTLLESLSNDELEAVLAHELGHFKRKHIIKSMVLSFALSLLGLWLLSWLMQNDWFYQALGVSTPSTYMALLLFTLVVPIFTFILSPIFSMLSRKNEFEADAFAAEQTDAHNLIQALVNMYKENASTLTPDPLYSAFYDSHPPAPVRIAHLAKL
ncbi:MAG: M48 family metallopeptidase [Gammaproteobacteria bacterium]|nr:M48 family metallopeptidase [Gammaproteobacteria bacterium]